MSGAGDNPLPAVAAVGAAILAVAFVLGGTPDMPVPEAPPMDVRPPPATAPGDKPRVMKLRGDEYGQFWTQGVVNGLRFRFLLDTGAGEITFGRRDAHKLGLDPTRLEFDGQVSTANGTVRSARARVDWLQVGPFLLRDVPVMVDDSDMDEPLLGMGFLRRFKIAVRSGVLTLSE